MLIDTPAAVNVAATLRFEGVKVRHLLDILRRFHDDTHSGAWPFCDQRPCRDLRNAEGGGLL